MQTCLCLVCTQSGRSLSSPSRETTLGPGVLHWWLIDWDGGAGECCSWLSWTLFQGTELCFRGTELCFRGQNSVSGELWFSRQGLQSGTLYTWFVRSAFQCREGAWRLAKNRHSAWKCLRTEIVVLSYSAVTICRCASLPSCCFWCTNLWQAVNIQELTNCQHLCNRGKHLRMQQPCWCALNQWRAEKAWLLA